MTTVTTTVDEDAMTSDQTTSVVLIEDGTVLSVSGEIDDIEEIIADETEITYTFSDGSSTTTSLDGTYTSATTISADGLTSITSTTVFGIEDATTTTSTITLSTESTDDSSTTTDDSTTTTDDSTIPTDSTTTDESGELDTVEVAVTDEETADDESANGAATTTDVSTISDAAVLEELELIASFDDQ